MVTGKLEKIKLIETPSLMGRLLKRSASSNVAVADHRRTWTYKEFVSQAERVATFLRGSGITRIMLKVPQGYSAYVLMWGAYLAGTTFCNLGENFPLIRVNNYMNEFAPDIVISDDLLSGSESAIAFLERVEQMELPQFDAEFIVDPKLTAYVLFTSGSTGQPKGVMISRQSLEVVVEFAGLEYDINANDIWAQYSSLAFDLSILDVFTAPAFGAALVPFSGKGDKLMPGRLIERFQITIWHSVPSAFELIDRAGRLDARTLASLRTAIFCGERLFPTLVEKIFSVRQDVIVYNNYGPTEATIFCTFQRLSKESLSEFSRTTVSIGASVPGSSVSLEMVDDDIGELVIRGFAVGKGYLSCQGASGYAYGDCDAYPVAYYSGDFCLYENNVLYFVCRKDRQIKISGNRVDLSELDLHFRELGCEAAISLFDENMIKSFVIGGSKTIEELFDGLAQYLPSYYVPSEIYKLEKFPYAESGKVDAVRLLHQVNEART